MYCRRYLVYFQNLTSKVVWGLSKQHVYETYPNARSVFEMGVKT